MHTTTPTTTSTILAIDLGKYKSVACAYDPATAQAAFDTRATTADELHRWLAKYRPAVRLEGAS